MLVFSSSSNNHIPVAILRTVSSVYCTFICKQFHSSSNLNREICGTHIENRIKWLCLSEFLGDICGSQYEFRRSHDLDGKELWELFTDICINKKTHHPPPPQLIQFSVIATGMWLLDDDDEHMHIQRTLGVLLRIWQENILVRDMAQCSLDGYTMMAVVLMKALQRMCHVNFAYHNVFLWVC